MPDSDGQPVRLSRETLLREHIFGFEHGDPRAAPFAMLRTQMQRRLDRIKGRMLAVTSAQPRDGKSFVAANLAAALSQIHPTCLVDIDLRRPTVQARFGLRPQYGIDDYLAGGPLPPTHECELDGDRLTIVAAREPRVNSADMLAGGRTNALVDWLRGLPLRPICVIDAPPVLEGDDMMILGRHVDGVLFVVQEGRTRQSNLREALRLLSPTPILGSVLNRSVFPQVTSPYGYYAGYRPER